MTATAINDTDTLLAAAITAREGEYSAWLEYIAGPDDTKLHRLMAALADSDAAIAALLESDALLAARAAGREILERVQLRRKVAAEAADWFDQ